MLIIESLIAVSIVLLIVLLSIIMKGINRLFEEIMNEDKVGGYNADSWMTKSSENNLSFRDAMMLEYPYASLYKDDQMAKASFDIIAQHTFNIVPADFIIPMLDLGPAELTYKGIPQVILMAPDSHDSISWLSDYFNEDVRIDCKRYNEKLNGREYWHKNKKMLWGKCKRNFGIVTVKGLADTMYPLHIGCTAFRPELVTGFIKLYGAKSVLDISAGWGDRLLGCLAAGVRYVGVDPNTRLHPGYRRMIDMFAQDKSKYTLECAPFQTATLPDETFDMVFTSPPYFDVERYSDEETQSINEFTSVDEWYTGFLIPSLSKAWAKLNPGGHMVLHINNTPGKPDYVIRMRDEVNTFPNAKYLGILGKVHEGSRNNPYKARPVWIWQKEDYTGGEAIEDTNTNDNVVGSISIQPLNDTHIDALMSITQEKETMAEVANGQPWSRKKILGLIKYAEEDSKLPFGNREYHHWAIMLDDSTIGYIGLYPMEDKGPQVRIFISKRYQGKGYGGLAMKQLLSLAKKEGVSCIYYQARVSNTASKALAIRSGFTEVPGVFYVGDTALNRLIIDFSVE